MKNVIATENAPQAIGPYSQAIRIGDFIVISGQLPINSQDGSMPGDIKGQTKQSLANVKAILESEGLDMSHIIKTGVFLDNMGDFAAMNEVYGAFFEGDYPARAALEVAKLPKDALVEIEAWAYIK